MANTRPKTKTDFIHCRTSPTIKAAAMKLAKKEGRSLSDLLEEAIKLYYRERYLS